MNSHNTNHNIDMIMMIPSCNESVLYLIRLVY